MGNLEAALADSEQAISINPQYAPAYAQQARIYADQGELQNARESFQQAVEIDPTNASVSFNYGMLLMNLGELDKAIEQFQTVIEHGIPAREGDVMYKAATQLNLLRGGMPADEEQPMEEDQTMNEEQPTEEDQTMNEEQPTEEENN
jgi:Tfp pilus assembly protein PilF